ncbi:MAG TPA: hypothetical protein VGF20_14695 [Candidatus Acidoferrum sp.]|jgi:hypothetical protein
MNPRPVGRILATLLLGTVFGLYIHADNKKWSQLGRQAYIDHQLEDFDSNKATPQSKPVLMLGAMIVAAILFGAYELIALAFAAIFKSLFPASATQQTPPPPSYPFA